MKITDARVIQTGEKELMEAIIRDLDWDMIVEMFKTKYSLNLAPDRMELRQGDLVVHQNQVAYKLDFDVKVTLSVMVDRRGKCFDVATSVAVALQAFVMGLIIYAVWGKRIRDYLRRTLKGQ